MTESASFDPNDLKLQPLGTGPGLLDQFNLPPKMIAFLRRHQRTLWTGFIVVLVLSLGGAGFNAYRNHREQLAASALDAALIAPKENKTLLEKVVADYGSTDSALWAKVELAALTRQAGQADASIKELESIRSGLAAKSPLMPLLLAKLAVLYENERQLDKALALYTELSARENFAAEAYRAMGRVDEQLGKKEDAVVMYGKYLDSESGQSRPGQSNPIREMVQSRLNQLKK